MSLFGALVRTTINVVALPVVLIKDIIYLGGSYSNNGRPYTLDHLDKIKREAENEDD